VRAGDVTGTAHTTSTSSAASLRRGAPTAQEPAARFRPCSRSRVSTPAPSASHAAPPRRDDSARRPVPPPAPPRATSPRCAFVGGRTHRRHGGAGRALCERAGSRSLSAPRRPPPAAVAQPLRAARPPGGQSRRRSDRCTSVHPLGVQMCGARRIRPRGGLGRGWRAQPSSWRNAQRTSSTLRPLATQASSFIRAAWGERKPAGMIAVPRRSCSLPA
jgi:hypothetical protein